MHLYLKYSNVPNDSTDIFFFTSSKTKKILEGRHKQETEFSHLNEAQMTNTETTPYQNCNFKLILSFQCNYVITNMLNKASYFTLKLKLHSALTAVDFKNQHCKRCLLLGFQIQRYNVPPATLYNAFVLCLLLVWKFSNNDKNKSPRRPLLHCTP